MRTAAFGVNRSVLNLLAAAGAALLLVHIGVGMAASAVITFAVAALGHLGRARPEVLRPEVP